MSKLQWYINRLRAMNVREVLWRLDQKRIERAEAKRFGKDRVSVGACLFPEYSGMRFDADSLGIAWPGGETKTTPDGKTLCNGVGLSPSSSKCMSEIESDTSTSSVQRLSSSATHSANDSTSNTPLQSDKPEKTFAANETCTDNAVFKRSDGLSSDHGMTSVRGGDMNVGKDLGACSQGISEVHSTKSEANDMDGGFSGFCHKKLACEAWMPMLRKEAEFVAHSTWREKVVCEFGDDDEGKIIDLQGRPNDNENENENHSSENENHSSDSDNENDNHQWEWVLQLASLVTGVRYSSFETVCENTRWLFTEEEIEAIKAKPYFANDNDNHNDNHNTSLREPQGKLSSVQAHNENLLKSRCFEVGGNTFLRDREDRVLIGIDHAELGFGSIAAHGHADALSFQMLVDGEVVFADPGTYIYHCDLPARNAFRRTINHNTLCLINDNDNHNDNRFIDQSKMLGAFMWGDRAVCTLEKWASDEEKDILIASHDGYKPVVHRRQFEWDKVGRRLTITDSLNDNDNHNYVVTFMLGAEVVVNDNDNHNDNHNDNCVRLKTSSGTIVMTFEGADRILIEDAELSPEYGVKVPSRAIRAYGHETTITTTITISLG